MSNYNDASGGFGISNLDFVLTGLDEEFTMGVSGELTGSAIPGMDVSATAIYTVSTTKMRDVFRFQTDAADVDTITSSGTDTKYYVNMDQWSTTGILNPAHAMMDHTLSDSPIATGSGSNLYNNDRMLVKHDFVRYLALKLFNTHQATDLFSNEDDMKEDLAAKGASVWESISGDLHTADANNPMSNSDDTNNFSRQLLEQIINNDRDRLYYDSSAGTINDTYDEQPIPLVDGDTISFKVTISAAPGQHNLTGVSAIGSRSYKIKLVLGSVANTTPTETGSSYNSSYYQDNGSSLSMDDGK